MRAAGGDRRRRADPRDARSAAQSGHEILRRTASHQGAQRHVVLVDDFGRQKFDPAIEQLVGIVPMENQIDYLKLNTGTSFSLPFDELLVFSTNLQPSDLMDPAFLRRIPYKIKL